MKSTHLMLALALLSPVPASFAQSDTKPDAPAVTKPKSEEQKTFDQLKALTGNWEGSFDGKSIHVSMRTTSMGNTLMHEMKSDSRPDNPITMVHLDNGRVLMTHYCDAGNQPRFVASASPDGKTITFNYLDATNLQGAPMGHMQHVVFTIIDADHHTELWQFAMANGKTEGGVLNLTRTR